MSFSGNGGFKKYIEKECPQCNGELYVQDADGNSSLCDLCNGSGALGWLFEDKLKGWRYMNV